MGVQIKEVGSRKDLKSFIRFPNNLYRDNRYYVPPLFFDEMNTLRSDKNPAFDHCDEKYWLALSNGRVVGRVAGILNRLHIEKWNQPYVRFGWFDFVDDPAVSEALLNTVESWARKMGMTAVHGPLGFTDLDREGMLVEGFEEVGTLATNYNHSYYPCHMEKMGYCKDIDWLEFEISLPEELNPAVARIAATALRQNKLRLLEPRSKKDLLPYAKELFQLLSDEYNNLYGVVPLTRKQVDVYVKQYFGFVIPKFVPVVVDENNRMVAFGITMPSVSRALQSAKGRLLPFGFIGLLRAMKKNDRADLYLVAVKSEYQGRAVNAILMNRVHEVFHEFGIKKVESNPELETNQNVQSQWKFYEKRQHKRRRCFIKHLD